MSKLFTVSLFGLAGLGLAVTGCGGGGGGGEPAFGLSWDLHLLGTTNQLIQCDDAGTPTVNLDTVGPNGVKSHDSFPCSAMTGTSLVLPRGRYQVAVSLQNTAGQVVSGTQSTFDLTHGGVNWLPNLTFDIQSFSLTWSIFSGNTPVMCDQVGARTVRFTAQLGDAKPMSYLFPCSDRAADTTAIEPGVYALVVELLDAASNPMAAPMIMGGVVVDDKTRAVLEPVTFNVN
jgi:hypothetical protein